MPVDNLTSAELTLIVARLVQQLHLGENLGEAPSLSINISGRLRGDRHWPRLVGVPGDQDRHAGGSSHVRRAFLDRRTLHFVQLGASADFFGTSQAIIFW